MEKTKKLKFKKPLNIVFQICVVLLVVHIFLSFFPLHLQVYKAKANSNTFQKLATSKGIGNLRANFVAQGTTPGSQKYYLDYQNASYALDLVVIDPSNNYAATTYTAPITGQEEGAFAMGKGSDNNVYLGTEAGGHILQFNTTTTTLNDLGGVPNDPVSHTVQTYIWQFATSYYDGKLYGCTYPSSDLISYDPSNNSMANLGTMDSANQYAHYCTTDPSYPYVYVGTGTVSQKIAAYNIQTGTTTTLLTASTPGVYGNVWLGSDNKVYGTIGGQNYTLSNGVATATGTIKNPAATNVFSNGDTITLDSSSTHVNIKHTSGSTDIYPFTYQGGPISIFNVAKGPDGALYTGSILPFYLEKYDFNNIGNGLVNVAPGYSLGGGEPYSMFSYNNKLLIANYAGPLFESYDPTLSVSPLPYTTGSACGGSTLNPQCVNSVTNLFGGPTPDGLRPQAFTVAPDGNAYAGSVGAYGQTNGPLLTWNIQNNTASAYYAYPNLGVSSLVSVNNCTGVTNSTFCLVAGTTTSVGGGATSTATTSGIFIYDPVAATMTAQYAIPNVTSISQITDLIINPANNYVFGIANATSGSYLFIFDPANGTFINGGTKLPFTLSNAVYNSAGIASDGNIWGLTGTGVFMINLGTTKASFEATAPVPITAGFSLINDSVNGDKIYFSSNADLYVYSLPFSPGSSSSVLTSTPDLVLIFLVLLRQQDTISIPSPLGTTPLVFNEDISDNIQPTPHVAKYITYLPSSGKAGTLPEETTKFSYILQPPTYH